MSIENDSEYSMDFNNPVLVAFRRNVEVIVNSYYGIGNYDTSVNRYDLQYSTVIGVWNGNYSGYNCYAYALQRTNGWF